MSSDRRLIKKGIFIIPGEVKTKEERKGGREGGKKEGGEKEREKTVMRCNH